MEEMKFVLKTVENWKMDEQFNFQRQPPIIIGLNIENIGKNLISIGTLISVLMNLLNLYTYKD